MTGADIMKQAREIRDYMIDVRRRLHAVPGVGFDTEKALEIIKSELEGMGYVPEMCGRAGITATVGGKKPGKVFLLRADIDALPGKEEAQVDFRSENGCMHACGHDMHTAILLGAAKILKMHEDEICGRVKLMFQSAEEILEGAKDMIEAGVLENPHVDAAMMLHVMAGVEMPAGMMIVSPAGVTAPAADFFEINVQGAGCHGAMPNTGIDPLNAAAHILIALQEINARELASNDRAALTIGFMRGGEAPNVIPDRAEMGGSLRAFDEDVRDMMKRRIVEISQGIAAAFRAKAEVKFTRGCPSLYNDPSLTEEMGMYLKAVLGEKGALSAGEMGGGGSGSSGSEDFAYVSRKVPSVMLALAAGQPSKGHKYPQHHPMVTFDEEALEYGCAAFAYGAMAWLEGKITG